MLESGYFDRWDDEGVIFHFGYDSKPNLEEMADNLPKEAWSELQRPPQYNAKTGPRQRPDNVKEEIVYRRGYEKLHLMSEQIAEFEYRPGNCGRYYRMIVIRKNISHEKGQLWLFDDTRYFFYITNDIPEVKQEEIVFSCNDRCNQENVIRQLVSGVPALHAPVDNLLSNWAYMLMTSLAWTLKVWLALWLPEGGRWAERHEKEKRTVLRMTFRRFVRTFIQIPCQIVRGGRRLIYRLLNWNPWLPVFRRLAIQLHC